MKQKSKRMWAILFKAPAVILLIVVFLAGLYLFYIKEIGLGSSIILGIVLVLYYIGSQFEKSLYNEITQDNHEEKEQTKKAEDFIPRDEKDDEIL